MLPMKLHIGHCEQYSGTSSAGLNHMAAAALKAQGNAAMKESRFADAVLAYSAALELDDLDKHTTAVLLSNRSAARLADGSPREALKDAVRCTVLRPAWYKGHMRKAVVFRDGLRRHRDAHDAFLAAAAVAAKDGDAASAAAMRDLAKRLIAAAQRDAVNKFPRLAQDSCPALDVFAYWSHILADDGRFPEDGSNDHNVADLAWSYVRLPRHAFVRAECYSMWMERVNVRNYRAMDLALSQRSDMTPMEIGTFMKVKWCRIGEEHEARGEYDQAVPWYRKCVEAARMGCCECDKDSAPRAYARQLAVQLNNLGMALKYSKQMAAAEKMYVEALNATLPHVCETPRVEDAFTQDLGNLANCLCNNAIRLNQHSSAPDLLKLSGLLKQAKQILDATCPSDEDRAQFHMNQARFYGLKGNWKKVRKAWLAGIAAAPTAQMKAEYRVKMEQDEQKFAFQHGQARDAADMARLEAAFDESLASLRAEAAAAADAAAWAKKGQNDPAAAIVRTQDALQNLCEAGQMLASTYLLRWRATGNAAPSIAARDRMNEVRAQVLRAANEYLPDGRVKLDVSRGTKLAFHLIEVGFIAGQGFRRLNHQAGYDSAAAVLVPAARRAERLLAFVNKTGAGAGVWAGENAPNPIFVFDNESNHPTSDANMVTLLELFRLTAVTCYLTATTRPHALDEFEHFLRACVTTGTRLLGADDADIAVVKAMLDRLVSARARIRASPDGFGILEAEDVRINDITSAALRGDDGRGRVPAGETTSWGHWTGRARLLMEARADPGTFFGTEPERAGVREHARCAMCGKAGRSGGGGGGGGAAAAAGSDEGGTSAGDGAGALRTCSRCRLVAYCSAECQKKHWKAHKATCVQWTSGSGAEEGGGGGKREKKGGKKKKRKNKGKKGRK